MGEHEHEHERWANRNARRVHILPNGEITIDLVSYTWRRTAGTRDDRAQTNTWK